MRVGSMFNFIRVIKRTTMLSQTEKEAAEQKAKKEEQERAEAEAKKKASEKTAA